MTGRMKRLAAAALTLAAMALATGSAQAERAASLDALLEQVKKGRAEEQRLNQQREAEFQKRKAEQQKLLAARKAVRAGLERRSQQLEAAFNANEQKVTDLEERLRQRMGNLGELFGVVRQVSGDTASSLRGSLTSAQFPGRIDPLIELSKSKELPRIEALENLWFTLQQEMTESGKVVRFDGEVVMPNGERVEREIVRVGVFNAISEGRFLHWDVNESFLTRLSRQPEGRHLRAASALQAATSGEVTMSVDPSRGALLGLLVQRSTIRERVSHGGTIGYAIIGLACVGLLLVAERAIQLALVSRRMKRQRTAEKIDKRNPLGRVLAVYNENRGVSVETLELKLDEAIQKETPKLERFLTTIKVLAVMAPLMGLLGTVTGMIIVFQDIQLFGSGDPKIMAGGISQALVTTVLGLLAALPLILSHSLLHGRAKHLVELLDEQSTGLVARRAEAEAEAQVVDP